MKRLLFPIFCLGVAFADQSELQTNPLSKAVSLYEKADNDGVNLGIKADFLYMQYSSPFLSFVASVEEESGTTYHGGKIYPVKGKGSLGCDVALNYTMSSDPGYSFQAEWYHIYAKFSSHVSKDHLQPAHIAVFTTYATGTASNKTHDKIDIIDLCLSKKFSLGQSFTFSPFGGAVGMIMKTKNRSNFTATSGSFGHSATWGRLDQSIKNDSIGAKVGFDYAYNICGGFNIAGRISYNAFYGLTKMSLSMADDGTSISEGDASYRHHYGQSLLDFLTGLSWQRQFCDNSLFLDIHAGWRVMDFFNGRMQFEAEFNDAVHALSLFGQGLEVGFTFKF